MGREAMADETFTADELRSYIKRRITANNEQLVRTRGTEWYEPDFYDGANTAMQEMLTDFGLDLEEA